MVQAGGQCKGAAVSQCWVTAGATMTRLTRITFLALKHDARRTAALSRPRDGQCAGSYVQSGGFEIPAKLLALADEVIE